jgi:hypothetical protein
MLDERIEELKDLTEKIQGESLPELEGLSIESRRLINSAIIAFAQYLVIHFAEHDLASLARAANERPVGDMKFGDRRDCDKMVECIRERIQDLKQQQNLPERVRKRTEQLIPKLQYRSETDAMPLADSLESIELTLLPQQGERPARRSSDAPLSINVLNDDYWDLQSVLR